VLQYFHTQLETGFTVILQNNIRVWVANYNHPIAGTFRSGNKKTATFPFSVRQRLAKA
jgi:hypothetical protein